MAGATFLWHRNGRVASWGRSQKREAKAKQSWETVILRVIFPSLPCPHPTYQDPEAPGGTPPNWPFPRSQVPLAQPPLFPQKAPCRWPICQLSAAIGAVGFGRFFLSVKSISVWYSWRTGRSQELLVHTDFISALDQYSKLLILRERPFNKVSICHMANLSNLPK